MNGSALRDLYLLVVYVILCVYYTNAFDCELPIEEFPNGSFEVFNTTRLTIQYTCDIGLTLVGSSRQTCSEDGIWQPLSQPNCVHANLVPAKCARLSHKLNSRIEFSGSSYYQDIGDVATVICDHGYTSTGGRYKESFQIVCGPDGKWMMPDGSRTILSCSVRRCPVPPVVPKAVYRYGSKPPLMGEGSRIEYTCHPGYYLVDNQNNYLICKSGSWEGSIPTCVRKSVCYRPVSIPNGHWRKVVDKYSINMDTNRNTSTEFQVGSRIEYYCNSTYKPIGSTMLQCTDHNEWSKIPPICVPITEPTWFCPNLAPMSNGVCKCAGETSNDLSFCQPFERGFKIECMCNKGYRLAGSATLTCTHGKDKLRGTWDVDVPFCLAEAEVTINRNTDDSNSYSSDTNSNSSSSISTHVSTLVIVIATACSVLGVLLLVMVIVVFRRKKQRPHLFHPGMAPAPYSRVNISSIDDHDRVALMAYADATRVHLPTYEEAMQQGQYRPPNSAVTTPTSITTQGTDYRPLPHIPNTIRTIHNGSENRHSSTASGNMNRDGTSEIFGSIDTVNVSMSDASTSGTVETFDSGTSTRSISSQRATAGSLMSSADNLANDDTRLLETRSEYMTEVTSQSPIQEKED